MSQRICSIDGCEKPHYGRGWCNMHYARWWANGDPGPAHRINRGPGTPPPTCSVEDCDRPAESLGWCARHYSNDYLYGNPIPVADLPLSDRLERVGWEVTSAGCWEWSGKRNDAGYGLFTAKKHGYLNARAHRAMWEFTNGPIPEGLLIRHRCDNPPCVNPDHLEPGTTADNSTDMVERNRSIAYRTGRYGGVCVNGLHDVTQPGALREVHSKRRGTHWICVGCARMRQLRYAAKKRAQLKKE